MSRHYIWDSSAVPVGSPDDAEGSGPGYYPWQQIGQKFINHNARRARNYLLLQLRAI